jgi:plastocyanin
VLFVVGSAATATALDRSAAGLPATRSGSPAHPSLPTTGPQRTVVIAPDGTVLDPMAAKPDWQPAPGIGPNDGPTVPDPGFAAAQIPGGPCVRENSYEGGYSDGQAQYGADCKRISFAFGPLAVRPGQNSAILAPVTIEKPRYDGYVVRFKPDLIRAVDGSHPPTEVEHLHHATWLNLDRQYGDGPFFAAGEEKTIANFPPGSGLKVLGKDQWGLLYMVHSAVAQPDVVWLTYQIDFVPTAAAEAKGITAIKPLWLDVQKHAIASGAPNTSSNPVFNAQKGFGHLDPETGQLVCRWPDENCAHFDVYGNATPQQGVPEPAGDPIKGNDWTVTPEMAGTLIGLGGHLHPGGIRDEVSLVRGGVEKPIFISDALHWNFDNPEVLGAPPTSWNFSMTATGTPLDWKVRIKPGDVLRTNAVYDSQIGSWYENMGIVVAYVAPDDPSAVDVFDQPVTLDPGTPANAILPEGPYAENGFRPGTCQPNLDPSAGELRLCLRGQPTHGAIAESGNATRGCTPDTCPAIPDKDGPVTTDIHTVDFTFGQADLGVVGQTGVPRVRVGQRVRFWNEDTVANVWHTVTRCALPCTGATKVNYPVADGGSGDPTDTTDFESMEVGYGLMWEPAKSQIGGNDPYDQKWLQDGLYWDFTPNTPGTYSFFCRVHGGMRGAIKVVP